MTRGGRPRAGAALRSRTDGALCKAPDLGAALQAANESRNCANSRPKAAASPASPGEPQHPTGFVAADGFLRGSPSALGPPLAETVTLLLRKEQRSEGGTPFASFLRDHCCLHPTPLEPPVRARAVPMEGDTISRVSVSRTITEASSMETEPRSIAQAGDCLFLHAQRNPPLPACLQEHPLAKSHDGSRSQALAAACKPCLGRSERQPETLGPPKRRKTRAAAS